MVPYLRIKRDLGSLDIHYRIVDKPKAIALYMLGVDLSDQLNSYNMLQHRTLKWWKKVVLYNLLETSVTNAKVIYKQCHNEPFHSDQFRLDIITGLLTGYKKPSKPFCRPSSNPPSRAPFSWDQSQQNASWSKIAA